jgi:flagellin
MGQVINTNVTSLYGQSALNKSNADLRTAMARLSSGMRINTAKDDPTGMTTVGTYEGSMRGALMAQRMINEALATAQTNDGYHAQIYENLQRIREIAVQKNGTASGTEYTALAAENTRLLALAANTVTTTVADSSGTAFTSLVGTKWGGSTGAGIGAIETDLGTLAAARATYGADMSTFSSASAALGVQAANAGAQYSAVMDTDYAVETTNMTRASIKQQAGSAMLAQANQIPNQVLALLRF